MSNFAVDENGSPIIDQNGNKIEFSISYSQTTGWYKHREGIHINDDNHLDTEDRHIIVKEGVHPNHVVCKKQLDEINNSIYSKHDIDNKLLAFEKSINQIMSELRVLKFRNDKMNNRIPSNFNSN